MKSDVKSNSGNLEQFATSVFRNPFVTESWTEWRQVFAWMRRPLVLAAFLIPSLALVIWRYANHRAFVLRAYQSWEDHGGVRCGTGLSMNQLLITTETVFTLTSIGVVAIAGWGRAGALRQRGWVEAGQEHRLQELAKLVRVWMVASLLWIFMVNGY